MKRAINPEDTVGADEVPPEPTPAPPTPPYPHEFELAQNEEPEPEVAESITTPMPPMVMPVTQAPVEKEVMQVQIGIPSSPPATPLTIDTPVPMAPQQEPFTNSPTMIPEVTSENVLVAPPNVAGVLPAQPVEQVAEVHGPTESAPEYNEYENPPFETFDEFEEALKAEPQGWLLEGIIPLAGYVMLAGAGLLGKTRTICAIIGALLKPGGGAIVAGRKAGESSVLYIHLEHQGRPLADNLKRAAKAHGVEKLTNVHLLRVFSLDDDRSVKAVADYAEAKNIGLVVIDSLRRASDGEENQSADTAGWEKQIRKLSGKGKRLVVVIHHTGKGNAGPRGSSDLRAQVDTLIELTLVEGGIELKAEHHQAAPVSFRYCLVTDDEAGTLEIAHIETPPTPRPSQAEWTRSRPPWCNW